MKYKLINPPNLKYTTKEQILVNRGIDEKDLYHYMHLTDDDINEPETFGKELMDAAGRCFLTHINKYDTICIILDCDCDGYTSAATLINYIYDLTSEDFINKHVWWYIHDSKQHGLSDCMEWVQDIHPQLLLIPDAGSNDIQYIETLYNDGTDIIVLDHHDLEAVPAEYWKAIRMDAEEGHSANLYLINSQSPHYPNKFLSGAGVVYQFCRYIDHLKREYHYTYKNYADDYLDLVATGNIGDMMSLQSFETRRLAFKGLEPSRITNPFLYGMWQKNMFKLGEQPTAWGFTFYVVPLINAITRSGSLDEKELIFNSMLKFRANTEVMSNKRGHKPGEKELLVTQAVRTAGNVKRHQSDAETAGMELVEHLIKENNMLDHKVLLFLLEPGDIKAEIRGLVANKLMAKYQRPCCMLTKVEKDGEVSYEGSARGCDKVGVTEFKDICAETGVCEYTVGHQGAFGLGIRKENIDAFIEKTDEALKDMASEPVYYVDYIWSARQVDPNKILEIADMAKLWGKDMDEALIAVEGIKVTKDNLTMMASNTVKITLPNGISLIKFRMPDEEYNKLYTESGNVEINIVAKCNKNEWNGNVSAQLLLEDYGIVRKCAYEF